ncbi:MAG: DUF2784 domain-containing protein [Actinomycetota bacterium]|nr:DUF2784 domain-containing protein [Actinomycetota bacterium]
MFYDTLVNTVVLLHFCFILFVATGALLAWRWPRLAWAHLPASAWGLGTVIIGFPCPLTVLEKTLRRWAGASEYEGGFVDQYIEDIIYPQEYSSLLRAVAVVMIVAGYVGLRRRFTQPSDRRYEHVKA